MGEVYIVRAKRTPIGSFGKSLQQLSAVELGVAVAEQMLQDLSAVKEQISEVYIGNVFKSGLKGNPARQIAMQVHLPVSSIAQTIDMQCASGMAAVIQGANRIQLGEADLVLAGGIESMTNVPHLQLDSRWGKRLGNPKTVDALLYDGLVCAIQNYHMGVTAENLVRKYNISRKEQDEYALSSQEKALSAITSKRFQDEVVPIITKKNGQEKLIFNDEHPKETSLEKLSMLTPAFEDNGTVTAGNASGLNDGASLLLLASEKAVRDYSLHPIAKVKSSATYGVDPSVMGIGPVPAMIHALEKANYSIRDMDLIEINEAFAAQVLAVKRELNFDEEKLNVNGGAIALGHPVGASGARIITTLIHELIKREQKLGIASLCIGGGMGAAVIVERI